MNRVSQSAIMFQLGFVPRRPMPPVTYDRSSGTAVLPSSAFATPAPSRSAASITSYSAPSAPAPTSIATRFPELRTSAARRRSPRVGITSGLLNPVPVKVVPCFRSGDGTASISWISLGRMMQVTVRSARAIRIARSIRWRIWTGLLAICTKCPATSLKSEMRSTSCWYSAPRADVAC